ncbi:hypothetical protein B0H13DRAFT_1935172 [Mycena leptocephala]|nr:hypothetical protein B0H13DRAFT_1935172 [Mycena leptocephala]
MFTNRDNKQHPNSRLGYHVQNPSQEFKATIMVRLGDAVARAAEKVMPDSSLNFVEQDSEADVLNGVAEFLSRFALAINGELTNPWNGLRDTWLTEVNLLKGALENLLITVRIK